MNKKYTRPTLIPFYFSDVDDNKKKNGTKSIT